MLTLVGRKYVLKIRITITLYCLEEEDFYFLPILCRLKNVEELSNVLPEKAVIVRAYSFRDGMTVFNYRCVFGVEGFNGGTEKIRNDMAKMFATHYGKAITSGSDFHEEFHLAKGGIETDEKI